jgi:hypothetical protein
VTTSGSATTTASGSGYEGYTAGNTNSYSFSTVSSGSGYYDTNNANHSASGSSSGNTNWSYNQQAVSVLNASGTTTTTTSSDSGSSTWSDGYSANSSMSASTSSWGSGYSDATYESTASSVTESDGGSSNWSEAYTTVTAPSGSSTTTGSGSGSTTASGHDSYSIGAGGWSASTTWGTGYSDYSYNDWSIATTGADHYSFSGGWSAITTSSGSVSPSSGSNSAWGNLAGTSTTGWSDYDTTTGGMLGGTISSGSGGSTIGFSSSYSGTGSAPAFGGGPFDGKSTPVTGGGAPSGGVANIPGDPLNVVAAAPVGGTIVPQAVLQVKPTTSPLEEAKAEIRKNPAAKALLEGAEKDGVVFAEIKGSFSGASYDAQTNRLEFDAAYSSRGLINKNDATSALLFELLRWQNKQEQLELDKKVMAGTIDIDDYVEACEKLTYKYMKLHAELASKAVAAGHWDQSVNGAHGYQAGLTPSAAGIAAGIGSLLPGGLNSMIAGSTILSRPGGRWASFAQYYRSAQASGHAGTFENRWRRLLVQGIGLRFNQSLQPPLPKLGLGIWGLPLP